MEFSIWFFTSSGILWTCSHSTSFIYKSQIRGECLKTCCTLVQIFLVHPPLTPKNWSLPPDFITGSLILILPCQPLLPRARKGIYVLPFLSLLIPFAFISSLCPTVLSSSLYISWLLTAELENLWTTRQVTHKSWSCILLYCVSV